MTVFGNDSCFTDVTYMQGRWWFGSRQKTKDGVSALTAASFFKSLREESGMDDVVGTLGKSYAWESVQGPKGVGKELEDLEGSVSKKMGKEWSEMLKLAGIRKDEEGYERRKRALVLLYAHFLRVDIVQVSLQRGMFAHPTLVEGRS
jgi:translocation protein SEC63